MTRFTQKVLYVPANGDPVVLASEDPRIQEFESRCLDTMILGDLFPSVSMIMWMIADDETDRMPINHWVQQHMYGRDSSLRGPVIMSLDKISAGGEEEEPFDFPVMTPEQLITSLQHVAQDDLAARQNFWAYARSNGWEVISV